MKTCPTGYYSLQSHYDPNDAGSQLINVCEKCNATCTICSSLTSKSLILRLTSHGRGHAPALVHMHLPAPTLATPPHSKPMRLQPPLRAASILSDISYKMEHLWSASASVPMVLTYHMTNYRLLILCVKLLPGELELLDCLHCKLPELSLSLILLFREVAR